MHPLRAPVVFALVALVFRVSTASKDLQDHRQNLNQNQEVQQQQRGRHNRFGRLGEIALNLSELNERWWSTGDDQQTANKQPGGGGEDQEEEEAASLVTFPEVDDEDEDEDEEDQEYEDGDEDYDEQDMTMMSRASSSSSSTSQEDGVFDLDDEEWRDVDPLQSDGPSTSSPTVNWNYFGNRNDLRPARRQQTFKKSESRKVQQHTMFVSQEGACKTPKMRLLNVQRYYPDASKTYIPHCTVLHRCGDDTGCCMSDALTCKAKTVESVDLYFYVRDVTTETTIQKLTFDNHTECECASKTLDYMVEDETLNESTFRTAPIHHAHHEQRKQMLTTQPPEFHHTEAPIALKKCHCPSEFSVRTLDGGECECDCFNKQKVCMRIKRGKEFFGYKDRQCIHSGQCRPPSCEFGEYIAKIGKCPNRHEGAQREDGGSIYNKHSRFFKST